jgi:hypothetical protein
MLAMLATLAETDELAILRPMRTGAFTWTSILASALVALVVCSALACGDAPIDGPLASDDAVNLPDRVKTEAPEAGPSGTTKTPDGGTTTTSTTLTVTLSGSGTGTIASTPAGVTCTGTTCKGTFARGTMVSLTTTPAAGSVFGGWSGGCTGSAACAIKLDADAAAAADLESLDGAWSGTYTNGRSVNGCMFNNAGKLAVTGATSATAPSQSASVTGLELRNLNGCSLVGTTTGAAPSSAITLAGGTLTGTWTFDVQGANGTLAFPFTAKVTGKTMAGTWTCTGCTGSFTLTKL